MSDPEPSVRLEGVADLRFVDALLDELDRLWGRHPELGAEDAYLFTLAVAEVATNVVQHSGGEREVRLLVRVTVTETRLLATVQDDAAPFRMEGIGPMPDAGSESGRGLALTDAVLDEFTHAAGSPSGNTWSLARARR